ncbi:MAG: ABC transporter permease [Actinobacteria bacterium]|nr:ABC transporter permease [Actinomycetota bacterium]MCI0545374.1 ABC transporter permease [Actinomycetota bacterium]MCI0678252.1 ABC transporter permease [Actinomycetota bacterium]
MTVELAPPPPGRSAAADRAETRRRRVPYLLLAPGLVWLFIFYVIPLFQLLRMALTTGNLQAGYVFDWVWENFTQVFTTYQPQLLRSLVFALATTMITLLIAYPLAYAIAFRGGRYQSLFLLLLLMPLLFPFLMRTLAWRIILADQGVVVQTLQNIGLLPSNGRLLATGWAVVAGLVYNFLPFMALPIYVSLEKIDNRLIEAANDLYSTPFTAFRKVTLPLSMPGVISGSLLTMIPAAGDYVNVELLGNPQQAMMGNVVQNKFLNIIDYPAAAAISFTLMVAIVILVLVYVRSVGTEDLVA